MIQFIEVQLLEGKARRDSTAPFGTPLSGAPLAESSSMIRLMQETTSQMPNTRRSEISLYMRQQIRLSESCRSNLEGSASTQKT